MSDNHDDNEIYNFASEVLMGLAKEKYHEEMFGGDIPRFITKEELKEKYNCKELWVKQFNDFVNFVNEKLIEARKAGRWQICVDDIRKHLSIDEQQLLKVADVLSSAGYEISSAKSFSKTGPLEGKDWIISFFK